MSSLSKPKIYAFSRCENLIKNVPDASYDMRNVFVSVLKSKNLTFHQIKLPYYRDVREQIRAVFWKPRLDSMCHVAIVMHLSWEKPAQNFLNQCEINYIIFSKKSSIFFLPRTKHSKIPKNSAVSG